MSNEITPFICPECQNSTPCDDWLLVHDGSNVRIFEKCELKGKLWTKHTVVRDTKEACEAVIQQLNLTLPPAKPQRGENPEE